MITKQKIKATKKITIMDNLTRIKNKAKAATYWANVKPNPYSGKINPTNYSKVKYTGSNLDIHLDNTN